MTAALSASQSSMGSRPRSSQSLVLVSIVSVTCCLSKHEGVSKPSLLPTWLCKNTVQVTDLCLEERIPLPTAIGCSVELLRHAFPGWIEEEWWSELT